MKITFSKYHGLGNDFIIVDDSNRAVSAGLRTDQVPRLCDRHTGAGADGLILRQASSRADHRMVLFNADGSPAEISGNGLRCFALFLKERGYDANRELSVETGGGVQRVRLINRTSVETTLPLPAFGDAGKPVPIELCADGKCFMVVPVNVGKPHGVIFGPERDEEFARHFGSALEKHPSFSEGANIEFVNVISPRECRLVVWERGAGFTLACGSGSEASACAGAGLGHFEWDAPIAVHQPGGTLEIVVSKGFREVRQRGPAVFVFKGEVEL